MSANVRSVVEIPPTYVNEPLPEVEYGLKPRAEPHASLAMTPTPDRDSQAAMFSEPDLQGTIPSEGRAGSTLDAPVPLNDLKAPVPKD